MTHQNHQTNGASLEDCHTNFFALTELYGIKWRKLVWGESSNGEATPLTDPVISSYARCLAGDILCVWRRVPGPAPPGALLDLYDTGGTPAPPPLSLQAAKELWIFWYGEEPDLSGLVAPELTANQNGDQGSWESGLSYECRSLLFKALHNLIERCLLSRDFVRLGKWFVQPYDGDEEEDGKSPWHLSFSFAFFLHGESTVCASVDVRQHPPVRTLTHKRLARVNAPDNHAQTKVILAPFGLEGTLTGREWSDADPPTARLLDSWRQLYPLEQGCPAVEVICGSARMRYPLPYVLVTEMEGGRAPGVPPAAIAHKALQALTTPAPHQTAELCYADAAADKTDDFVDPTRKTPCTCAKWRRRRAPRAPRAPPFHRRAAQRRRAHISGAGACSPASCGGGSPAHPVSAPSSAGAPPPSPHAHHAHAHHTPTTNHQSSSTVPTTLHTPAPTPDPHAPPTPAPPSLPPPKQYNQGDSPGSGGAAWHRGVELTRRPVLPSAEKRLDPLEDEHSLHMLYDYTTVHAWLEHPVKRFKPAEAWFRSESPAAGDVDLYAGHEHTRMPPHAHARDDIKHEKQDHDDSKEYKNLYTSDGLSATFKDLDQIFDNSDDAASGDETVRLLQVQTPPDSNKSMEEARCGAARCVRAEELSKMFPTPPSLEAHAQPSPGFTQLDEPRAHLAPPTHLSHRDLAGSPAPDHPIEDWSYVFKPPTVCKYVGSSKYAPLAQLPSALLPAVSLPVHAVYRPRVRDVPRACTPAPAPAPTPAGAPATPAPPAPPTAAPLSNDPARNGVKRSLSPAASAAGRRAETRARRSPGGARSPAAPPRPHPACPLLLNVLLADTVLNVFRDHNFDSCTLCVCNAGPKVVGNIRGADAATYLNEVCGGWGEAGDEEPPRCTCGFSAVVNRRRAHKAGLFYEDEMEITGLASEPESGQDGGGGLGDVAALVIEQCAGAAGGDASALARAARRAADHAPHDELQLNVLEYKDGGAAAARALRAAGGGPGTGPGAGACGVHRWPFIMARAPFSSRDVVRLMRRLRPLLQDAIQKRCCGARMWDGVTGPLTWRQFHRLAGRGNEDLCEPQPVPPLLVGHDRDWLALAPYALRHWERLSLEPYSYPRDVAYVVLAADAEALHSPLQAFFRELSAAYEACRLGRHRPLHRLAPGGIMRAEPSAITASTAQGNSDDEWTGPLPTGRTAAYLRGYVETLRSSLVPQLASLTVDRTLFDGERPDTVRPPTASEPGTGHDENEGGMTAPHAPPAWLEEDESGAPALVIYVVEPPASHANRPKTLHALLRIASRTHHHLHHHNPLIKIISLESVCETWGFGVGSEDGVPAGSGGAGAGAAAGARALAFSVFTGARRLLHHRPDGKSLTGFGTAASANLFLLNKDEKNRAPYKLFSPAWVLSAPRSLGGGVGGGGGGGGSREVADTWTQAAGEQGAVLYLAYCLSHDQRWLLAAATDARGELLDTAAINIHVPHRSRRRRSGPARRLGLTKLMDFTLGVMSQAAQPWRLVVGRVGRIGHGELKGWSWLLSRKHLTRASTQLRELCGVCGVLPQAGVPCILSACLVSTEPEPALRLMADRFTPDERFSQHSLHSALHTPRDVTATHILVFPTSATTQSNQMPFEPPMANGEDNDLFLNVDMGDEEMGDDQMTDIFSTDMFNSMFAQTSPRRLDEEGGGEEQQAHAHASAHQQRDDDDRHEQVGTVLQQPLALGYLVSTAPLAGMPAWWWAGCGHLRDACPAFLRSGLHLHAGSLQQADDFTSLMQRRDHNAHPLDSQLTTDVLRYVLEGYNALSWLALDGNTADRVSCLPLHVQVLMQLYHTAAALG